jgi:hypothetical protein
MKAIQDESPTQILMSFVEKGADVNIKADGESNCSCSANSLSFVSVGPYQWSTALQLGSSRGDKEFVAVLLAHGADPNIPGQIIFPMSNGVPYLLASSKGSLAVHSIMHLGTESWRSPNSFLTTVQT